MPSAYSSASSAYKIFGLPSARIEHDRAKSSSRYAEEEQEEQQRNAAEIQRNHVWAARRGEEDEEEEEDLFSLPQPSLAIVDERFRAPAARLRPAPRMVLLSRRHRDATELYLRSDIDCHSSLCSSCPHAASSSSAQHSASVVPTSRLLSSSSSSHYLIPSSACFAQYMQLLSCEEISDMIVLRSCLTRLSSSSSSSSSSSKRVLRQIKTLLSSTRQRIVVFENEHCRACHRPRRVQESEHEHEQRLMRAAARYLHRHLHKRARIVLVHPTPLSLPDAEEGESNHSSSEDEQAPESEKEERGTHLEAAGTQPRIETHSIDSYIRTHHASSSVLSSLLRSIDEAAAAQALAQRAQALNQVSTVASASSSSSSSSSSAAFFPEYLSEEELRAGVKSGVMLSGLLKVRRHHSSLHAFVDLNGRLVDLRTGRLLAAGTSDSSAVTQLFVFGWRHRNRAIDGDEVVCELLPRAQWRAVRKFVEDAAELAAEFESSAPSLEADDENAVPEADAIPSARIVGVLSRNWRSAYAATLLLPLPVGSFRVWAIPMDSRLPKVRIATRQAASLASQRIVIALDDWRPHELFPTGRYVRALGDLDEIETSVAALLLEHSISHPAFSDEQLECLSSWRELRPHFLPSFQRADAAQWKVGSGFHARASSPSSLSSPYQWNNIPASALRGRRDLRSTHRGCCASIDPIGCEDIDDCLSVLELPRGRLEIGVHIADVSAFVEQDSALDLEARARGTSVYLVDRRLDMLPSLLSEDLCSLRGGCDRLCLSVIWTLDEAGALEATWMGRTVIHNSFALSYEEAQDIVESGGVRARSRLGSSPSSSSRSWPAANTLQQSDYSALLPKLQALRRHALRLKKHRVSCGAVELSSLDLSFQLDEKRHVVALQNPDRTQSGDEFSTSDGEEFDFHHVIEEFMVAANAAVAFAIHSARPDHALLRRHPPPRALAFAPLLDCAARLGIALDVGSNLKLAASFRAAELQLKQRFSAASTSSSSFSSSSEALWSLRVLKELGARCMSEAQYFCSGDESSPNDFSHYGLAVPFYTHFTSPIRRYADVVVHRLLLASLGDNDKKESLALTEVTRHLNDKNRAARTAGKESQLIFLAAFLSDATADGPLSLSSYSQGKESEGKQRRPRVQRVSAFVTKMEENGVKFVVPSLHLKGAVRLIDRDGRSLLAPADRKEESLSAGPRLSSCRLQRNADSSTITFSSSLDADATFTLRLFDTIELWMSLTPKQHRYRVPTPEFTLIAPSSKSKRNGISTSSETPKLSSFATERHPSTNKSSDSSLSSVTNLDILQSLYRDKERRIKKQQIKQGIGITSRSLLSVANTLQVVQMNSIHTRAAESKVSASELPSAFSNAADSPSFSQLNTCFPTSRVSRFKYRGTNP